MLKKQIQNDRIEKNLKVLLCAKHTSRLKKNLRQAY
jgi:hypothetical protein